MAIGKIVLAGVLLAAPAAFAAQGYDGRTFQLAQAAGALSDAPTAPAVTPPALPPPTPAPLSVLPPPLPPAAQFFYDDGGKPAGPLSLADIGAKVAAGAIKSGTLVWKSGNPAWVSARDLPEVAALLPPVPTLAPTPPPAAAAIADVNGFILGTWLSEDTAPAGAVGTARLTLTFTKGGTLNGTYAYTPIGAAGVSLPVAGVWAAESAGARRAKVALNLLIQNGAQTQTFSTSSIFDIVDDNTLRDTSDGSLTTRVR